MVFFARLIARLIILGSVSWWLYREMELSRGTFWSLSNRRESVENWQKTKVWSWKELADYSWVQKTISIQPWAQHYNYNQWADTDYPSWFQPNESQDIWDLNYWLNILPFSGDRQHDSYLVVPKAWAIAPIYTMPDEEIQNLLWWDLIDYNSYLERGVLQHPGTPGPEESDGNFVIAGHTSYYHDQPGDYKTFMQFLILLHPGDLIIVFKKNSSWSYDRYMYRVASGYQITADDVSILNQDVDQQTLTLYGCYPFGSISHRRVVNATFFDPNVKN